MSLQVDNFEQEDPLVKMPLSEVQVGEKFYFREGEHACHKLDVKGLPPGRERKADIYHTHLIDNIICSLSNTQVLVTRPAFLNMQWVRSLSNGDVIIINDVRHMMYRKDGTKGYFAPIGQQGNVARIPVDTYVDHVGNISDK